MNEGRIITAERFTTSADGVRTDRTMEHYWLCERCEKVMKVVVENGVASAVPMHMEPVTYEPAKAKGVRIG